MQYRLKLASSAFLLLVAAASAQACGHVAFDELPDVADGSTDGGPLADTGGDALDASDGDAEDAFVRDGAVPDASCLANGDCPVIYVSAATGKKGNPGTIDAPVDTIEAGLALVTKLRKELHIASGQYSGPVRITGEQDVQLHGGFECTAASCSWKPNNGETIVTATDLFAGALYIGSGHGRGTIVSNMHFKGAEGTVGVATDVAGAVTVRIVESAPVLQHLIIDGPLANGGSSVTAKRTIGVLISGKQPDQRGVSIDDCTITGGKADALAAGILVEDGTTAVQPTFPALDLTASDVTGGLSPSSYAVLLTASGPATRIHDNHRIQAAPTTQAATTETWAIAATGSLEISRNVINGTNATDDYCKNLLNLCGGIFLNNAEAKVFDNVVHGVHSAASAAIVLSMSGGHTPTVVVNSNVLDGAGNGSQEGYSAAVVIRNANAGEGHIGLVRNDILIGGTNKTSYGVAEAGNSDVNSRLAAFDHNDIQAETAAYHAWFAGSGYFKDYSFGDLGSAPIPNQTATGGGNIGVDCLLDEMYHLGAHSPCINAGTSQDAPNVDLFGDPRPYPLGGAYDIGVDESKLSPP